jgi:hypothetical protein
MNKAYQDKLHLSGRYFMLGALLLFIMAPITLSLVTGEWPTLIEFLPGFIATASVFWPITTIEVFTFTPMLGTGSSYLAFVTGNLTSIKVPVALNAQDALNVEKGSESGDLISTIAVATSSIVTTLIILLGAILFIVTPLGTFLENDLLNPAFDNVLPALFGALGFVYISKRLKIAAIPILFMLMFFLFVPNSMGLVGAMVPVGVLISIIVSRVLYKKGLIK